MANQDLPPSLALRRYGSVGGGMEGKERRHFHASERGKVS